MVAAFDVADVNANPARFDPKKCEAINATHIRLLPAERVRRPAGRNAAYIGVAADPAVLDAAAPLVQERIQTLGEGVDMLRFLLVDEVESSTRRRPPSSWDAAGQAVLAAAEPALAALTKWTTPEIESALRARWSKDTGLGLKPRNAYGPVRAAVTGRTVSPPLFESLELLGRDRALARLRSASGLDRATR